MISFFLDYPKNRSCSPETFIELKIIAAVERVNNLIKNTVSPGIR